MGRRFLASRVSNLWWRDSEIWGLPCAIVPRYFPSNSRSMQLANTISGDSDDDEVACSTIRSGCCSKASGACLGGDALVNDHFAAAVVARELGDRASKTSGDWSLSRPSIWLMLANKTGSNPCVSGRRDCSSRKCYWYCCWRGNRCCYCWWECCFDDNLWHCYYCCCSASMTKAIRRCYFAGSAWETRDLWPAVEAAAFDWALLAWFFNFFYYLDLWGVGGCQSLKKNVCWQILPKKCLILKTFSQIFLLLDIFLWILFNNLPSSQSKL